MKRFIPILIGQFISNVGSGMTAFALSYYVYQQTKSVSWVSLITILSFLPTILLNPVGGILADRFDRRGLMISGDLFSIVGLLIILFYYPTGNMLPIIIGVLINAVFISLLDPAYKATMTDLLTEDQYARASGLVQLSSNAKYLISPALAGVLLKFSNLDVILMIDSLTIIVSVLAVLFVKQQLITVQTKQPPLKFLPDFKEGIQYIFNHQGSTRRSNHLFS